jgi:hypothetical protein
MRTIFSIWIAIVILLTGSFPVSGQESKADHSAWNRLLMSYVNQQGMVNYKGMLSIKPNLDHYLTYLSGNIPNDSWPEEEKLAYWINAYNAFTVSLILEHYPLKSIMDIDKAWDQKFIHLDGGLYSLNQIEHEIIRKEFDEPRIHFVLVCAAVSCPILLNEAYDPQNLEKQMQKQGEQFINDSKKNKIGPHGAKVSQVFNWFKDDFTKKSTLIEYLNEFSDTKAELDARVDFMEYDWSLNEQK